MTGFNFLSNIITASVFDDSEADPDFLPKASRGNQRCIMEVNRKRKKLNDESECVCVNEIIFDIL